MALDRLRIVLDSLARARLPLVIPIDDDIAKEPGDGSHVGHQMSPLNLNATVDILHTPVVPLDV